MGDRRKQTTMMRISVPIAFAPLLLSACTSYPYYAPTAAGGEVSIGSGAAGGYGPSNYISFYPQKTDFVEVRIHVVGGGSQPLLKIELENHSKDRKATLRVPEHMEVHWRGGQQSTSLSLPGQNNGQIVLRPWTIIHQSVSFSTLPEMTPFDLLIPTFYVDGMELNIPPVHFQPTQGYFGAAPQ